MSTVVSNIDVHGGLNIDVYSGLNRGRPVCVCVCVWCVCVLCCVCVCVCVYWFNVVYEDTNLLITWVWQRYYNMKVFYEDTALCPLIQKA